MLCGTHLVQVTELEAGQAVKRWPLAELLTTGDTFLAWVQLLPLLLFRGLEQGAPGSRTSGLQLNR